MRMLVVALATLGLSALAIQGGTDGYATEKTTTTAIHNLGDLGTAGVWEVSLLFHDKWHVACRAGRRDIQGASVALAMRAGVTDKVSIYLRGPSFGEYGVSARALGRIDDGEVLVMSATQMDGSAFDTMLELDYSQAVSDAIKKGKALTIVINGYKYTIPLTDTGKMIDAMASCMADGQSIVDDMIFDNAVEATLRGASR